MLRPVRVLPTSAVLALLVGLAPMMVGESAPARAADRSRQASVVSKAPAVSKASPGRSVVPTTTRPRGSSAPTAATTKVTPVAPVVPIAPAGTVPTSPPLRGEITVAAASSLQTAFGDLAAVLEKANPGLSVRVSAAGSSTLAAQILQGAPFDVFASADRANMDRVRSAVDGEAIAFAANRLTIIVGRGNPLRVKSLSDLSKPEVFVALGAPGVPIGDYAREALKRAKVDVNPKTFEASAASIVTKVALREVDAGIVYVTDVASDEYRTDPVPISDDVNVTATYPVAVLRSTKNRLAARAFVELLTSEQGQSILRRHRFAIPA